MVHFDVYLFFSFHFCLFLFVVAMANELWFRVAAHVAELLVLRADVTLFPCSWFTFFLSCVLVALAIR